MRLGQNYDNFDTQNEAKDKIIAMV